MNRVLLLIVSLGFFACEDKKGIPFSIEGTVKNAPVQMIYLEQVEPDGSRPVIVDSAKVDQNGKFGINTEALEQKLFTLRFDAVAYPIAYLVNDTKKLSLTIDPTSNEFPYSVQGSPASQEKIDFDKGLYRRAQAIRAAATIFDSVNKIVPATDSASQASFDSSRFNLYMKYNEAVSDMKSFVSAFMEKTTSPVLTLYALQTYQARSKQLGMKGFSKTEEVKLVARASERFPDHAGLKEVKNTTVANKAPALSLPDTSGRMVSISDFKGKYVLVDFWASWCSPCRAENPNIVAAYNQYRNKNFTILGVSLDQDRGAWLKAIQDDGLNWNHISDLKFWNSEAAAVYNITEIPYNVLLDPDGNIIEEGLHGPALGMALEKILK
jgi:peroxiredoxin